MNNSKVYSEVYAVLTALNGEYIRKTSIELLDFFADNRDKEYIVKIDEKIPLEKQKLSKESLAVLALLKYHYWCDNENERLELIDLIKQNGD